MLTAANARLNRAKTPTFLTMTTDASLSDANFADQLDAWAKKLSDTAQSIRRAGSVSMDHRVTTSAVAQDILKTMQSPIEHLMGSLIMMV